MAENFTAKQKEVIARKMGYEGPMQGFDMFLNSSPALASKFNAVTNKYATQMATGGMATKRLIKKYAAGGAVGLDYATLVASLKGSPLSAAERATTINAPATVDWSSPSVSDEMVQRAYQEAWGRPAQAWEVEAWQAAAGDSSLKDPTQAGKLFESGAGQVAAAPPPPPPVATPPNTTTKLPVVTPPVAPTMPTFTGGVTGGGAVRYTDVGGKPVAGSPATVTPALNAATPDQSIDTSIAPPSATTSPIAQAAPAATAMATPTAPASTVTSTAAAPAIETVLSKVAPATGQMTPQAIVQAQQGAVSPGALATAAQGTATRVIPPNERIAQSLEMVSGSGVDMAKAEEALAKSRAETAQGVVTDEMTVQGQLNKLMTDFDAGRPPPWAAATMRSATATMAARGLGASSMAGQAIVQAALEAATPIAAADAKVFEQMGLQNLSNRQQMAVLTAQQRAAFIGQDFDQTFQSKVLNAAKISDIANMNFTATQQIALENARLAQTMDLTNLSNQQASIMANAATIANMDLTNLSNRQQAAVLNAKSFLEMDMQNLQNEQQTTLFKAQQITTSLLSDAAADNASKQFNASSANQTNQFNSSLATQVSQFNTAQQNALSQFNTDQTNSISKFNAEAQNLRDQFNSGQRLVIDQSNVQWRREISTANTAATNAANYVNAQNLQAMTLAEYNNATQLYRDQIEMAWSSFEKEADRATDIIKSQIVGGATTSAARASTDTALWTAVGGLATKWASKYFGLA